jgi:hypothetical protein
LTPQGPKVEEAKQHILANASLSFQFCNKDTAKESIPVKDAVLGAAIQWK